MVATFVVLTVLGTWVLSQLFGSDPQSTTAGASTTPTGSAAPDGSGTPSDSSPSTSTSPSDVPEPRLPDAPKLCSKQGDDAVAAAWSGNRDTSCAFTEAVRAAYRKFSVQTGESFRAYSTVTKKWYDVTCLEAGGTRPALRCHSADGDAVVFLGP